MQTRVPLIAFLVLAAVSVLAAGCGGGSPSAAVANIGSSTTTTTSSAQAGSPGSSGTSGATGGGGNLTMQMKDGAKFAACMRSHGVPNFPDPGSGGSVTINQSLGIDPDSPKFKAAQAACQKLLPRGKEPTAQEQAKAQQQMLAFSACMRSHGVPDFPDPTFSNGRGTMKIAGGQGSDLDPSSPKFKAAQEACKDKLPGGKGLPGGPTTSK